MRYRLRTLLILLAIGPPMLAWWGWPAIKQQYEAWQWRVAVTKAKPVSKQEMLYFGDGEVEFLDEKQLGPPTLINP
jgi:hypothetical protein